MPFTTAECETWVKGLGLSEADQKVVLEKIGSNPDVLNKVGGSILAQGEFSRKMDELKNRETTLETEYRTKVEAEDRFRESLTGWKTQKEQETENRIKAAREESEAKLTAARERIRTLATAHGIPEDEIRDLVPTTAAVTRQDPPRDTTTGQFTRDDFNKEARAYVRLGPIINRMDREYFHLFGNDAPEPDWNAVIQRAEESKRPVADVFADTYKIREKRAELDTAKHTKEVEDARKAGEEAARSKIYAEHPELGIRTVNTDRQRSSPVLKLAREQMKDGAPKDAKDPNRAAKNAASAWNDGKYSAA